jgi:hypothetical protein
LTKRKLDLAEAKIKSDTEDHRRQLEAAEQARLTAQAKAATDAAAREHDAAIRAHERERRILDERQREHIENVSFWRKVLLEGAKTIGAIAATATLLIGWYAKKKAA